MTYKIEQLKNESKAIRCLICEKVSYNPNDLLHLFCGNCYYQHTPESVGKNEQVFKDLFGNVCIYDMNEGNTDVWEMHDNVRSGKWLILLCALNTNTFMIDFIGAWGEKFDKSMLVHETGNHGVMFISQDPSSIDIEKFKHYYGIANILK
jgi:hypothetical protein